MSVEHSAQSQLLRLTIALLGYLPGPVVSVVWVWIQCSRRRESNWGADFDLLGYLFLGGIAMFCGLVTLIVTILMDKGHAERLSPLQGALVGLICVRYIYTLSGIFPLLAIPACVAAVLLPWLLLRATRYEHAPPETDP